MQTFDGRLSSLWWPQTQTHDPNTTTLHPEPPTGNADLRGEIIKFVVAQDLFDLCAPEMQPANVALKKAILKWAGTDQAGAVQLVSGHLRY